MPAIVLFGGILGPLLLMSSLAMTAATTGSVMLNVKDLATMGVA